MSNREISLWKVEEFLLDNLKQIPIRNGKFKLEAECSFIEFIKRLEESV